MGENDYFKPGDWNVICDRCGLKKKRSQCRMTWDNLLVCSDTCWESRHPQDFVRGRVDSQRVPISRPDSQLMQKTTTMSSAATLDAMTVELTSVTGIYAGTSIGITLDNSTIQWVFATAAPSGSDVTISTPLWGAVASGNTVYVSTGDNFLTATQATATGL
jgi:hypothetical protein